MNVSERQVAAITVEIAKRFRTFGGHQCVTENNPIALALAGGRIEFAGGVPVADVVAFVLASVPDDPDEARAKMAKQLRETADAMRELARRSHAWTSALHRELMDGATAIDNLLGFLDTMAKVGR